MKDYRDKVAVISGAGRGGAASAEGLPSTVPRKG